jgi:hypothetical protein
MKNFTITLLFVIMISQVFRLKKDQKSEIWDFKTLDTFSNLKPIGIFASEDTKAYIFKYSPIKMDTLSLTVQTTSESKCCAGNSDLDFAIFKGDTVRDFKVYEEMKIIK